MVAEIENKIPNVSGLATPFALTKISEIEKKLIHHNNDKYITLPGFNKITA